MTKSKVKALTLKKTSSKGLASLIDDYRTEIKKVKWVTKQEVWEKAKLVIITSLSFGFLTYGADLIIRNAIDLCHLLFKWAF